MNKNLILLAFLISALSFGQTKVLDDLIDFEMKNSGVLMDADKNVDGYFFFYEVAKLKKGKREYAVKILDNNLNEVANKTYVSGKRTELVEVKFNNQAVGMLFNDTRERQFKLVVIDRQGKEMLTKHFDYEKKEYKMLEMMLKMNSAELLFPIDDKGFMFTMVKDYKKLGYRVDFIPTDGSQPWSFTSDQNERRLFSFGTVAMNDEFLIGMETSRRGAMSRSMDTKFVVRDMDNGNMIWEKPVTEDDPKSVLTGMVNNEGQIVLVGEYFKAGDDWMRDEAEGIYIETLSKEGNQVAINKIDWDNDILPKLPNKAEFKLDKDLIYFQDMVLFPDGSMYGIGEQFKKNFNALGLLSRDASKTKLVITDAYIFSFNPNKELTDIRLVEKGKSRAQSLADFASPMLNARALDSYGAFDHNYTQVDKDRNLFVATFTDYERIKGEKNKWAFKAVAVKDGEITEDKIYMDTDDRKIEYNIRPAKLGSVLVVKHDDREDTVTLSLEKLNLGF